MRCLSLSCHVIFFLMLMPCDFFLWCYTKYGITRRNDMSMTIFECTSWLCLDLPNLTNIQETTWTFTILYQRILSSHCLPIPALGFVYKQTNVFAIAILRPEWFEHSSQLSWAARFTNYAIAFLIIKQTIFKRKEE